MRVDADDGERFAHTVCRGEFTMTLVTRARGLLQSWLLHKDTAFIGLLHTDDGDLTPAVFNSIAELSAFLDEMAPRYVDVRGAPGEELSILRKVLAVPPTGARLH